MLLKEYRICMPLTVDEVNAAPGPASSAPGPPPPAPFLGAPRPPPPPPGRRVYCGRQENLVGHCHLPN
ncbi:hypothetical protein PAL_GLEAN10014855 [Pteropus alecto]|uniref:Uncharacterized protein n=1 Tax=Pteropus alecto TaxID=9402 RepID=L5KLP5_PTEAL|nr:hypothetical protein PAL_GLEAN10014855 [Pteropus alecto]